MAKNFFSQALALALAWNIGFSSSIVVAAGASRSPQDMLEVKGPQQTAEFIFRNSPRDNLITVQVFGSVNRPGMYYVPEDTDLMKLLTLAGGVVNSGELDEVVVRKIDAKNWKGLDSKFVKKKNDHTYHINVDMMVRETTDLRPLKMNHDDFIYIPQKEPFISNDLSKFVAIGSLLLTSILTVVIIREKSK